MKGVYDTYSTLAEKLNANTFIDPVSGCWLWTGGITSSGYAEVQFHGHRSRAHRASYECHVGPVPEGLDLDHTCHNPLTCVGGDSCLHRRCLNPAHLEPVTRSVNVLRGAVSKNHHWSRKQKTLTHCPQGHPYSPANTAIDDGTRICRTCKSARAKIHYALNREKIKEKVRAWYAVNAEKSNRQRKIAYRIKHPKGVTA